MLRASHAVGRFVGLCFLRGYLRFARFFNVNVRQLAVNGHQCFWACFLAMVVNALWVWLAMVVNGFATASCGDGH